MTVATFAFVVILPTIIALLCWGFADMLDESSGRDLGPVLADMLRHEREVSEAVDAWTLDSSAPAQGPESTVPCVPFFLGYLTPNTH